ncbi:hypothetical protein FACS1894163_10760 [Spirochaetia bacterium]|nr:hypothetical protein FACS1894163_10760 [Spirochaetia bacterium]
MSRVKYAVCISFVLSVFCSCTSFSTPEPRDVPEDFFGIAPFDGHELAEKDYAVTNDLGAVWFRRTFNWSRIEPNKGNWDFSSFDKFIGDANEQGKKIVAILAYNPDWLYENGRKYYIGSDRLNDYLNYVEQVVIHYKGKITAYEIWNEPNGLFWKGSIDEFAELTKAAAKKIRQIDPDATILAGSFFRTPDLWLNRMFKKGAFDDVDAISMHPYAVTPLSTMKVYDNFAAVCKKNNWTKDIWITEVGYPTSGWYPARVSLDKYPTYIVQTLSGLAARGARVFMWYELFDEYVPGKEKSKFDSEDFFGLIYPDFSYKKGAYAYALCEKILAGTTYSPDKLNADRPKSMEALYFIRQDAEGNFINSLIMWSTVKRTITVSANAGMYKLYDIDSGNFTEISGSMGITVTAKPVVLQWDSRIPNNSVIISDKKFAKAVHGLK